MKKTLFKGIIPAIVLPFKENYEIDEVNLRKTETNGVGKY